MSSYKLNMQALKAVKDRLDSGRGDSEMNFLKIVNGDNHFHILPPWEGSELPFYEVYLHFLKDENNTNHAYQCAKKFEGHCVLCERAKALEASGNEEDKKYASVFKWKKRYMYNAVNATTLEAGILTVTPPCHKDIIDELFYDVEANLDPFAYKDGMLLTITRSGIKWNETKYKARAQRQRISMPEGMEANHNKLPKLNNIYDVYTNAELAQVLEGNFDPKGIKNKTKKEGAEAAVQQQAAPVVTQAAVSAPVTPVAPVIQTQEVKPVQQPPVAPAAPVVNSAPSLDEAMKLLGMER